MEEKFPEPGEHREMFEDSLLEAGGRMATKKPLTVFISFVVQIIITGIMVLIPLIYTEALPRRELMTFLMAPPPPPPPPPPPAAAPKVRVVPRVVQQPQEMVQPKAIPWEASWEVLTVDLLEEVPEACSAESLRRRHRRHRHHRQSGSGLAGRCSRP